MTQREKIEEIAFKLRITREVEHNDNQWSTEFVYGLEEVITQIETLITEARQDARQEFREKFHIDPYKKYHVVGTDKAIIVTEWEHHKTLQTSLKGKQ